VSLHEEEGNKAIRVPSSSKRAPGMIAIQRKPLLETSNGSITDYDPVRYGIL
jgi:hypothetical protein